MEKQKLSTGYISSFCRELYLIMQAGIPLAEGVEILRQGEGQANDVLSAVVETLQDGYGLREALERTGEFPRYMVDMIGVGEQTGNLDRGLKALSVYYDRQEQMEQTIRRAVLYPALLLTMLTAVLVVLVVEVLPMFQDVYAQLGGTLTGLGAVILNFGVLLKAHWILAIGVVILVVILGVFLIRLGQKDGRRVLLSQKLGQAVAVSKLTAVLAMAVQSGLDLDMAMEMASKLTQHPVLREKIDRCRGYMAEGEGFVESIRKEKILSSLHCRMLAVGLRTGAMDEVMEDVANRCETVAQTDMDRHIGSVEPTLVMVMSVLVGVVLLSVMLPLASIMTSLG